MPELPLACFGKLPCYGDYLKVNVTQPTAHALRDLMLQAKHEMAISQDGDEEGYRDVAIDSRLRILFGTPGSRELFVGVMRPSRDSGRRHFPFVVFTYLTRRAFGRHYSLLPLALGPIWEALEDAWDSLAEATDEHDFRDRFEAVELPRLADVRQTRGQYQGRMREDLSRIFDGSNGSAPEHLTGNMPGVIRQLKSGENLSVQLPVSAELAEACFDVCVWMEMVNSKFRLKRFEPTVFLDERPVESGRWVVLRFGETRPADYIEIIGPPVGANFLRPAHPEDDSGDVETTGGSEMTYEDLLAGRY